LPLKKKLNGYLLFLSSLLVATELLFTLPVSNHRSFDCFTLNLSSHLILKFYASITKFKSSFEEIFINKANHSKNYDIWNNIFEQDERSNLKFFLKKIK
jgi:hypothetical protein